jgi:hypothetical protein
MSYDIHPTKLANGVILDSLGLPINRKIGPTFPGVPAIGMQPIGDISNDTGVPVSVAPTKLGTWTDAVRSFVSQPVERVLMFAGRPIVIGTSVVAAEMLLSYYYTRQWKPNKAVLIDSLILGGAAGVTAKMLN